MRQGWIGVEGGGAAYVRQLSARDKYVRRLDQKEHRIAAPAPGWPTDSDGWYVMLADRGEVDAYLEDAKNKAAVWAAVRRHSREAQGAYDTLQELEVKHVVLERKLASSKREMVQASAELERLKAVAEAGNDILGSDRSWAEKLKLLQEM